MADAENLTLPIPCKACRLAGFVPVGNGWVANYCAHVEALTLLHPATDRFHLMRPVPAEDLAAFVAGCVAAAEVAEDAPDAPGVPQDPPMH